MTIIVMATKSSTQAILTLMQDAQLFKREPKWQNPTVGFSSDCCEAEYRTYDTLHDIPTNNADKWRMFADHGALVLVLTYYYEEE